MSSQAVDHLNRLIDRTLFRAGTIAHWLGDILQERQQRFHWNESDKRTPAFVFKRMLFRNRRWAKRWHLSGRHPVAVLVGCMDFRYMLHKVFGDGRYLYDFLRLPGAVLSEQVRESIVLAVRAHKVSVVAIVEHTAWCAMHETAKGEQACEYPTLSAAIHEQEANWKKLLEHPFIAEEIKEGRLLIARGELDQHKGHYQIKEVAYGGDDQWQLA
jgi:hypothetical protein